MADPIALAEAIASLRNVAENVVMDDAQADRIRLVCDAAERTISGPDGTRMDPDSPLARAINKSWRTGETVVWNEGDPLP